VGNGRQFTFLILTLLVSCLETCLLRTRIDVLSRESRVVSLRRPLAAFLLGIKIVNGWDYGCKFHYVFSSPSHFVRLRFGLSGKLRELTFLISALPDSFHETRIL